MKRVLTILSLSALVLTSCSENYSNGERIGVITQFSKTGVVWKSHEGHLNVTQTGMNSSVPFDFSIDNDNEDPSLVKMIEIQNPTILDFPQYGWKIKLTYHETFGKNWFGNRGSTDHFITNCEVLERNFANPFGNNNNTKTTGHVIDTVYVVIVGKK